MAGNQKKEGQILLEVLSPTGIIVKEYADEVVLPTSEGEIAVLPNHAPLFTKLVSGEIVVKKEGKDSYIALTGGFLEFHANILSILADYAIYSEKIEAKKAEDAKRKAEQMLAAKDKTQEIDFRLAEKDLQRAILELKVSDRLQRRHK